MVDAMTHSTRLRIHQPCDPERLFGSMRQAIGIPSDTEIKVMPSLFYAAPTRVLESQWGIGADAALEVTVVPDGVTVCGASHHASGVHWDSHDMPTRSAEECHYTGEHFYTEVFLDTSYGAARDLGCLLCFHLGRIRAGLALAGQQLLDMSWHDEYNDEWHHELAPRFCSATCRAKFAS